MLLLVLAGLGVLVAEDEVYLKKSGAVHGIAKSTELTLLVEPHLSGPNMIMYGELLENSSAWRALLSCRSFM
jgi:hypothetical protein